MKIKIICIIVIIIMCILQFTLNYQNSKKLTKKPQVIDTILVTRMNGQKDIIIAHHPPRMIYMIKSSGQSFNLVVSDRITNPILINSNVIYFKIIN